MAAASGAAQSTEGPPNVSLALPSLRQVRVTCTAGHGLGGLFVLFRKHRDPWLDALKNGAPADPMFQIGMVGESGYLAPVSVLEAETAPGVSASTSGAWLPMAADIIPDTHRMLPQERYQVYLVNHPSASLARNLLDTVNAPGTKPVPQVLTTSDDVTLQIPEDPSILLPAGPKFYEGWTLFRDMPFGDCPLCVVQVKKLQANLGALRYMIGSSNHPYLPDYGTDADKSGGANDGIFDVRTMNGVASFQTDVIAKTNPFKVAAPLPHTAFVNPDGSARTRAELTNPTGPAQDPQKSHAFLVGAPTAPPDGTLPTAPDGVVDEATGSAVQAWLNGGLRKPGAILVEIQDPRGWKQMWARPEAARAWALWNELTNALGFPEGIAVNHTFRSAQVDVGHAGYGRSARSIHKTGLAMDLGIGKGFTTSAPDWPVAFSREKDGDSVVWRLWAPVKKALPALTDAAGANTFAKQLAADLDQLRAQLAPLPIFASDPDFLNGHLDTLIGQMQADPLAWLKDFYAHTIEAWAYDPYSPEGGTSTGQRTAPQFYAEQQAPTRAAAVSSAYNKADAATGMAKARAEANLQRARDNLEDLHKPDGSPSQRTGFLDLTKLGALLGLSRIHAFSSGWGEVVTTIKVASLKALGAALTSAKGSSKRSTSGDAVVVRRKDRKFQYTVADVDDAFMTAWAAGTAALHKKAKSVAMNVPQITVALAWGQGKVVNDASQASATLRGVGDKLFHGVDPFTETAVIQSGNDWATLIDSAPDKLKNLAPVNQPAPSGGAQGPKIPSKAPAPQKRSIVLQPVFLSAKPSTTDVAELPFLPGDVADVPGPGQPIGMEWWHFQRSDLLGSGKSRSQWGTVLMELGWTEPCLLDQVSPILHYRRGVGYPASELHKKAF